MRTTAVPAPTNPNARFDRNSGRNLNPTGDPHKGHRQLSPAGDEPDRAGDRNATHDDDGQRAIAAELLAVQLELVFLVVIFLEQQFVGQEAIEQNGAIERARGKRDDTKTTAARVIRARS
jgi:hypothetical protein